MTHRQLVVPSGEETDWLQTVATPLEGDPGGEDPRYCDDFAAIRQEIEKLQGADYPRVARLARDLLAHRAKDLRVAGYLALAELCINGPPGLLEAVRAYRLLLAHFWDACHPRRPAARLAALQWLNQEKFALIARQGPAAGLAEMARLQEELAALNALIRSHLGEDAPTWTVLQGWLQQQLHPPAAAPAQPSAAAPPPAPSPAAPAPASAAGAIASERELAAAVRAIREFLLARGEPLQAAYFSRAQRWGGLAVPPHDSGQTRVPPPRPAGWVELERDRGAGNWPQVLRLSEQLFLEPGGQYSLDLQAIAVEAARVLGQNDLADFIAGQTVLLVRRLPALLRLTFEDGRPFSAPATREWLEALQEMPRPRLGDGGENDGELTARLQAARETAQRQNLGEALALLRTTPVADERGRLQLRLAMARLCLEAQRPELALPLWEELHAISLAKSLPAWDERLAVEICLGLVETCRVLTRRAGEGGRRYQERAEGAWSQLCRLAPEIAAGLV